MPQTIVSNVMNNKMMCYQISKMCLVLWKINVRREEGEGRERRERKYGE